MSGQTLLNIFGMTSIEFLDHVFDINGVKQSDSRVQGINDFSGGERGNRSNTVL